MPLNMESVRCNVCESTNNENYLQKDNWEIMRCKNCGLVFLKNIPLDNILESLYKSAFFKDGQKSPEEGTKLDINPTFLNARKRLEDIRKYGWEKGGLLDIGCGTGVFLKAASEYYECIGLDISKDAVEFAAGALGVKAMCGNILDMNFKDYLFDIITMWDVIEHVRDPDRYIRKIRDIISPGGLLVLSTGDVDSLMFRIQGSNWHLLIPPQHLFYFNKSSITSLLAKNNFSVVKVERRGQYTNVGYIINKMKRLHPRSKILPLVDALVKCLAVDRLNIYLNLFDVMTVYARPSRGHERLGAHPET